VKKTLLNFDGFPLVSIKFFGEKKPKIDLFLNCPHGYAGKDFLRFFPFFKNLFSKISPDIFEKYLELEHDFCSIELAEKIAENLAEKGLFVAVIFVNCDRGILDANRNEEKCVRRIFDHEKHFSTVEILQKMNRKIADAILGAAQKNLAENGLFLDCHSMWPSSPKIHPSDFENPDQLEKYIFSIISPKNQHKTRAINFLIHDHNGIEIADAPAAKIIENALLARGFATRVDEPYRMNPEYRAGFYYQFVRGVSFDVPRHFLATRTENRDFYPIWKKDFHKINAVANGFSSGILDFFKK